MVLKCWAVVKHTRDNSCSGEPAHHSPVGARERRRPTLSQPSPFRRRGPLPSRCLGISIRTLSLTVVYCHRWCTADRIRSPPSRHSGRDDRLVGRVSISHANEGWTQVEGVGRAGPSPLRGGPSRSTASRTSFSSAARPVDRTLLARTLARARRDQPASSPHKWTPPSRGIGLTTGAAALSARA